MIYLKNVSYKYDNNVDGLLDVTLRIDNGEFCFIVGDSGSGKSTLSKLLSGELAASSGEISVNGFDMKCAKGKALARVRRTVGMVYQDFRLIPTWTVRENLEFAMLCVGAARKDIDRRVPEVLELVSLSGRGSRLSSKLSGGEQQRVAIARSIINHPQTIVADEPTGNLDPQLSQEVFRLLEDINAEEHATTIVITHEINVVKESPERIIRISGGRIVSDGRGGGTVV